MYKLAQNQISSKLTKQMTILDYRSGIYYGLNEVGTHIWETLQKAPADFEILLKSIVEKFEVDEKICAEDLREILEKMKDAKLIEEI